MYTQVLDISNVKDENENVGSNHNRNGKTNNNNNISNLKVNDCNWEYIWKEIV